MARKAIVHLLWIGVLVLSFMLILLILLQYKKDCFLRSNASIFNGLIDHLAIVAVVVPLFCFLSCTSVWFCITNCNLEQNLENEREANYDLKDQNSDEFELNVNVKN